MEVDPPSSENSDQGTGNTPKVRSYGCAFCKRGFSNAQALGGHMNIHRKDRAKLKEPFPITKKNLSSPPLRPLLPVVSTEPGSSLGLESNENKACTLGQAWPIVSAELQQLQLFVDRPSSSEPHKSGSDHERETQMTAYGSWAHEELDLELRLGPES